MLLRKVISELKGLRFMLDGLDIQSSLGKRVILDTKFMTSYQDISNEHDRLDAFLNFTLEEFKEEKDQLQMKLMQIRDIQSTINNLLKGQILDEIELFEIKGFLLLADSIRNILTSAKVQVFSIPDLKKEIELLDPESKRVPSFYIYDSYSERLSGIRKKIKDLKASLKKKEELKEATEELAEEIESLRLMTVSIEDGIREELSKKLYSNAEAIEEAHFLVAQSDILLAKALQVKDFGLNRPEISDENSEFEMMFNPLIKSLLKEQKKDYQPVSISLKQEVTLITGANMAGKTILLRTLALCQYLAQFGFFLPVASARIVPVERVMISIEDDQNELNGLSSFAAEMFRINEMIQEVKKNRKVLVLIDELARTTNPVEGKAIVTAVTDLLNEYKAMSIITTHYNGIKSNCRKLRVKGLIREKLGNNVNKSNINEFIDYSLIEDTSGSVPQEALWIAGALGVDSEIIVRAEKVLDHEEAN